MRTKNRPTKPARRPLACLRGPTAYSDNSVAVDPDAGVIRNVALMSVGPALGHGFDIDSTTIEQLVALANASGDGVKCRFKHPEITETRDAAGNPVQTVADDTGSLVGRIRNVRVEGAQARGDVYLGSYAEVMPGLGNVREYLIRHAQDDPAGIGMSAMFTFECEPVVDQFGNVASNPARIQGLDAIDFVGVPAANPRGLLSARAGAFDPQPPSSAPSAAGWQDPAPADPAKAPIPTGTPEFPNDVRGDYLRALTEHGPMHLGGIAARFSGRLESMRAALEWLASNGYAEKVPGAAPAYKATPKGVTQAAMCWR